MENQLAGKVAIVTGAMGDIGGSIILRLLEGGAKVLGVDINIKNAESKSVWENSVKSGALRFCQANVTKNTDVEAYTLEAITLFNRLDIVVLSAGVLPTPISWMDCEVASFDRTMAINTKGVFLGAKHAALAMRPFAEETKADGGGAIIIISSIAGLRARPTTSPYAASKFAVRGLCLTLAQELAPWHIRVNCVLPGVTDSAILQALPEEYRQKSINGIPMLRAGTTREQANAVAFLASSEASFVTGANWPVHGGVCPA